MILIQFVDRYYLLTAYNKAVIFFPLFFSLVRIRNRQLHLFQTHYIIL
jgi:hypothetical protein